MRFGDLVETKSGNSKLIKGKLPSSALEGLVPAFSASGQDVWTSGAEWQVDGVVLSAVGARCGKTFLARGSWTAIANTHVLIPKSGVDPKWLWYLTNDETFWIKGGTAQPFVKIGASKSLRVLLPPIEEQRRIAGVLDAAEALRAKRRQALDKLDSLTQAIFIDMFGDPVVNPMGWPVDVLTKLGDLDRGVSKHRPRNDPVLLGGGWPLIQTGDVAASNGYISEFSATYSDAGLAQSKIWPAGTLCITIAANIAKTGILTFDACFPDSVVGFRTRMEGAAEYTRCYLNFLQPVLEKQAPESAQKNINLKVLRELQIPVPHEDMLAEFAKRAGEVNLLCQRGLRHQASLNTLFASLQQRAFRGEL